MNRTEADRMPVGVAARHAAWQRWYVRLGMLLLSAILLSLSLAPVNLYVLAWIALVPWIVVVTGAGSKKSALLLGFLGGWIFFLTNMWWLWFVSIPGLFALTIYLAVFWGLAGVVIRGVVSSAGRPHPNPLPEGEGIRGSLPEGEGIRPILTVFLIAAIWVAFEWLRGNVSFLGKQGLPWLFLGQTQSPILVMCQIADLASVLGVSFWVMLVNALVAVVLMNASRLRQMIPAIATVAGVLIAIGVYGAFRISQQTIYPGPTVMVVQSNYKQSNTGEKGAPITEIVEFHVSTTRRALQHCLSRGQPLDLVVWSETMMPPINQSARDFARGTEAGEVWQRTFDAIGELAKEFHTAMLVGGVYQDIWSEREGYLIAADRRNSAFFFDATGVMSENRYDKIHLVPFGEYIPFESIPPIYQLFIKLGPNYYEEYVLKRGKELTVFSLESAGGGAPVRFVVPICFEDIVPSLVAGMIDGNGSKRADFLVNITNDGWFRANQMPQHLQAALFRSIENRVPTARSVNTGISGFVDPLGRANSTVAAESEGWTVSRLTLDRRVAPYTRIGDAFPILCVVATGAVVVMMVWNRRVTK